MIVNLFKTSPEKVVITSSSHISGTDRVFEAANSLGLKKSLTPFTNGSLPPKKPFADGSDPLGAPPRSNSFARSRSVNPSARTILSCDIFRF